MIPCHCKSRKTAPVSWDHITYLILHCRLHHSCVQNHIELIIKSQKRALWEATVIHRGPYVESRYIRFRQCSCRYRTRMCFGPYSVLRIQRSCKAACSLYIWIVMISSSTVQGVRLVSRVVIRLVLWNDKFFLCLSSPLSLLTEHTDIFVGRAIQLLMPLLIGLVGVQWGLELHVIIYLPCLSSQLRQHVKFTHDNEVKVITFLRALR